MLQDGIETHQSDLLPQNIVLPKVNEGIFTYKFFTYILSITRLLNSWEEFCINVYVTGGNS